MDYAVKKVVKALHRRGFAVAPSEVYKAAWEAFEKGVGAVRAVDRRSGWLAVFYLHLEFSGDRGVLTLHARKDCSDPPLVKASFTVKRPAHADNTLFP